MVLYLLKYIKNERFSYTIIHLSSYEDKNSSSKEEFIVCFNQICILVKL